MSGAKTIALSTQRPVITISASFSKATRIPEEPRYALILKHESGSGIPDSISVIFNFASFLFYLSDYLQKLLQFSTANLGYPIQLELHRHDSKLIPPALAITLRP